MWVIGLLALTAAVASGIAGIAHWKTQAYFNTMMASGTAAAVLGLVLLILNNVDRSRAAYAEFLQDCMQDRKQYECVLMWRASERPNRDSRPVIIPMPTPSR
jgi:hypothetical protein